METSLNELSELASPPAAPAVVAAPAAPAPQAAGDAPLPALSVGSGMRTNYQHFEPDHGTGVDSFALGDTRIYLSGDITSNISAMLNTDYDSGTNKMGILDAVGEFHTSPKFNVWFGRFLPPSDRANVYGPFYAHEWAVYTDGIQDGYPFVFQGRDNGAAYWGDFQAGKTQIKVSMGAFDGGSATGNSTVLGAARVQIDFWDPEGGDGILLQAREIILKTLEESSGEERMDWGVIKEKIRADLKRYISKQTSRHPLILPVILEI